MTARGIADQSVLQPVDRVTGVQDSFVDHRVLARRNVIGFVLVNSLRQRNGPGIEVDAIIRGRAGDDAVEVRRISLRFVQRLAAARRASIPVGELGAAP